MPETFHAFDADAVAKLVRDHERLAHQVLNLHQRLATIVRDSTLPAAYYAKTTSVLTAIAGNTLGSGTADIYKADSSGVLVAVPSLTGKTIKNIAGQVSNGIFIKVSPDQFGSWSVDVANCG